MLFATLLFFFFWAIVSYLSRPTLGELLPDCTFIYLGFISAGELPVAVATQETLIVLRVYKQPLQISLPSLSPEVICIVINS